MSTANPMKAKRGASLSRGCDTCDRCKATTRAFRDCLTNLIPKKMCLAYASDLAMAAECALEISKKKASAKKRLKIDPSPLSLLKSLDETIELCKTAGAMHADESDDGHQHMAQALEHCRAVLGASQASLVREVKVPPALTRVAVALGSLLVSTTVT